MVGVGGALLYAAALGAMAGVILGLVELGVTPWLAALVVTIIVAAIGGLLVMTGQDALKKADLVPRRTIETVREDADWAKERFQ
jgi:membrane protein